MAARGDAREVPEGYMRNPATGRLVARSGRLGKRLSASGAEREEARKGAIKMDDDLVEEFLKLGEARVGGAESEEARVGAIKLGDDLEEEFEKLGEGSREARVGGVLDLTKWWTPEKTVRARGILFVEPKAYNARAKYYAMIPARGSEQGKIVPFGHRDYEHYRDQVPKDLGGQKWSAADHNDEKRRARYRARAEGQLLKDGRRAIDVTFSPAWFSYHFLW